MDNLQKLLLFILAIPVFVLLFKNKIPENKISVNRFLLIVIIIFPFTFLTSFFNGSSEFLILQLTFLVPPMFILLFTLLMIVVLGEERVFKISAFSIVITSTIFSFIGLLQVMNVELLPLPKIIIPGSTIGHRGFAAEYLLPAIPFILILKNFIKKDYYPLLFFAGIINLSFLFFTRSRSALLISVLILGAVIAFILLQKNIKTKFKIIIPIAAVFLLSFIFSIFPPLKGDRSNFSANAASILDTENKSNKLRINFWKASIEMIKENPIAGIGLQKWSGVYPAYFGDEFVDSQLYFVHATHPHNDFIELFAENGFAAPLVFSLIIMLILYNLFKKIKTNENYFFIMLSALSTVGFGFISFPMSKFSSYFILAFSAGLALNSLNTKNRNLQISVLQLKYFVLLLLCIGIITSYERLTSELKYLMAIEYKNVGDYNNMVKQLESINTVLYPFDPSKQPIEFYTSTSLYHLRKLDEALVHSIKAEKIAPNNPLVLHNTAGIYQSQKKYDKAIIYYRNLQKQFPNYMDPQINLLIIYSETNQVEEGKNLFQSLIEKDSLNPRLNQFKSKYSIPF